MESREIEFKLLLEDRSALEALARAAERRGARRSGPVVQENHFFDTPDARLRAQRIVVRLREEEARFVLSIKGGGEEVAEGAPHDRPEAEAPLEDGLAHELLGRRVLPLEVLEAALGPRAPRAVREVCEAAGGRELEHVGAFRNHRLRVGPLGLPSGGPAALVLELDRTELPGGRVDHEVELEVEAAQLEAGRLLLEGLCAEAGVRGRPATSKARRFFEALSG